MVFAEFRWDSLSVQLWTVHNSQFTTLVPHLYFISITSSLNHRTVFWKFETFSLCNESNVRHFDVRLFCLETFSFWITRIRNIRIIINQFASYFSAPKRVPLQGSGGRDHHPDGRPKLSYESLFPSNVMNVTCYMYKLYICMTHLSP